MRIQMSCCHKTKLNIEMNKRILPQSFQRNKNQGKKNLKKTFKRQFRYVRHKQGREEKLFLIPKTCVKKVIILDWATILDKV